MQEVSGRGDWRTRVRRPSATTAAATPPPPPPAERCCDETSDARNGRLCCVACWTSMKEVVRIDRSSKVGGGLLECWCDVLAGSIDPSIDRWIGTEAVLRGHCVYIAASSGLRRPAGRVGRGGERERGDGIVTAHGRVREKGGPGRDSAGGCGRPGRRERAPGGRGEGSARPALGRRNSPPPAPPVDGRSYLTLVGRGAECQRVSRAGEPSGREAAGGSGDAGAAEPPARRVGRRRPRRGDGAGRG